MGKQKTFELKAGTGRLFKNEEKKTERSPDYYGEMVTPGGEVLQVAGWVKQAKEGGRKYISYTLSPPK